MRAGRRPVSVHPMGKRILIVQGHPDPDGGHLLNALADRYATAASAAGHQVRRCEIAKLDFPVLRSKAQWEDGNPPPSIATAQADLLWCEHLVLLCPLWLGDVPALLKAFLEQLLRPDFGVAKGPAKGLGAWKAKLAGRSARVVVTMGMPGWVYRWFFGAHALKSLKRNVLGFVGIGPIGSTLIGNVEAGPAAMEKHLVEIERLGSEAL
jgi:putative NADPH-quinone reductase